MRDHPDYILPLAVIAFGLIAELLAWAWTEHRRRQAVSPYYIVRKRGRIVGKKR